MLIFLRCEIRIFSNFVNTRIMDICSYEGSTDTLKTSWSFDPVAHGSIHSSSPVRTCNLPPELSPLTEKGLSF